MWRRDYRRTNSCTRRTRRSSPSTTSEGGRISCPPWTSICPCSTRNVTEHVTFLVEHGQMLVQGRNVLCYAVRGAPFVGAMALAHRGERDRALALADMARGDPERTRIGLDALYGAVLIACGDLDAGRAMAESAFARDRAGSEKEPRDRPLLAVIQARLESKDFSGLESVLPLARRLDEIPFAHAVSARAEGLVLAATSDKASGVRFLRGALQGFEVIGDSFESARTREMLAGLIEAEEREAFLAAALSAYEEMGARPHAERVRHELEGPSVSSDPPAQTLPPTAL